MQSPNKPKPAGLWGQAQMADLGGRTFHRLKSHKDYADIAKEFLTEGEKIIAAFKSVRDGAIFTDRRIIAVTAAGFRGTRKTFTMLPYARLTSYAVQTSGGLNPNTDLVIHHETIGKIKFSFKGEADVAGITRRIDAVTLKEM